MENKHSINTILSFSAKSVDPKVLERLLVGRNKAADYLTGAITGIAENGNNQHILVIAARGMGKTHLIRIMYDRCIPMIRSGKLMVAYFSEEEYGVSNYFDFLIRILYAFIRWNVQDSKLLQGKLEELQNIRQELQTGIAEQIIEEYTKDKPLLILAENFGDILNSIGPEEQGKLRAWLYKNNRLSIIATSQAISDDFDREDRPFYGFFSPYYLKTLTYRESLEFLNALAKLEGNNAVLQHLKGKGVAQVKAIHGLVKGNHRLLVTFYEFLKTDTLAKLSNHFIKTMNDLKPYYETYIRYLPAQQQKIIRFVALSRKPQFGTVIAKNCFIDQKSLSKQLSELTRKNLLEAIVDSKDKRNKLYDIYEPLLRISIEVGEHKEGVTALFIDFLALYYDTKELETKKIRFNDLLKNCEDLYEKREIEFEIQAINRAIALKGDSQKNREISHLYKNLVDKYKTFGLDEAIKYLESNRSKISPHKYKLVKLAIFNIENKHKDVLELIDTLSEKEIAKSKLFTTWARSTYLSAKESGKIETYQQAFKLFQLAIDNNEDLCEIYTEWSRATTKYAMLTEEKSDFDSAIDVLNKAKVINPKDSLHYFNIGSLYSLFGIEGEDSAKILKSFSFFEQAAKLTNDNFPQILGSWGISLAYYYENFDKSTDLIKAYFENIMKASSQQRIGLWKLIHALTDVKFFIFMSQAILLDSNSYPDDMKSLLIDWLNTILQRRNLEKADIDNLYRLSEKLVPVIPELSISMMYLKVYEKYYLEGESNAVYDLPKELRQFFEDKIINYDELESQ